MEGIFQEFENENSIRLYPFAAGCVPAGDAEYIRPDIFIDAVLYPVNPVGAVYLSRVSDKGVFSISDDTGVIMEGEASGSCIELYDVSGLRRHVGTLIASSDDAISEFAGIGVTRDYKPSETAFASGCVFPVTIDGVTSISVGESGVATGDVSFSNDNSGDIRVSSGTRDDGRKTLRFDVLPRIVQPDDVSIRRIICVVDGETPFRIQKLFDPDHPDNYGYNTVILKLEGIDRDAVCAAAHRENEFEMADTCDCKPPLPSEKSLPEAYQLEEVFIPPDDDGTQGGVPDGSENAFFLVVPNFPGYHNPLSITLNDGAVLPRTDDLDVVVDGTSVELAEGEMLDKVASKGVVIQVPGLSGGNV